jgi:LysM repeat protein
VPVKESKTKTSVNSTKKINVKPESSVKKIPTTYDTASEKIATDNKPKFTVCDAGSSNPSAVIAAMVRGITVVENGHTYHIVGTGETMTAISKLYNISIMELAELNRKDCERIKDGEKLFIK